MTRKLLVCFLVAVSISVVTGNASANSDKEAREAFKNALTKFDAADFDTALDLFTKAHELNPSWKLLYNIGQCEAALKRYGLALDHFERFLSKGGDNVPADRRDEVLAEVERLRKMVGALRVEAPKGSVVFIDDIERGRAPVRGKIRVAASVEHKVRVVLDGADLLNEIIVVGGADEVELIAKADTAKKTKPVATTHTDDPPSVPEENNLESETNPKITWGWVAVGTGAALIVGGAVTGGLALEQNGDLVGECDENCLTNDQAGLDKQNALATTSTILFGVGIAAVATGTILLILGHKKDEPSDEGDHVALQPLVGPGLAGASFDWRF